MIKGTDTISYLYDYITVYWYNYDDEKEINEGKCLNWIVAIEFGEEMPTFNQIVEIAKEHGYDEKEMLHLVADSALSGKTYCYGNYSKEWLEYGETRGYV